MATIGEAARRSGLGIETIRFYERRGITPAPARTEGGRRDYGDEAIRSLRLVRRCRDLGFPLAEAKLLLELAADCDAPCEDVAGIAGRNLRVVRDKLAALRELESALTTLIGHCREDNPRCPALVELLRD